MGRSYSFHPFHTQQPALGVQGSGPRLGNDEDIAKVAQQQEAPPAPPLKTRAPGTETVRRYKARAAAKRAAPAKKARTVKATKPAAAGKVSKRSAPKRKKK